ncbi:MAG: DivIVA domain-containing protein [Actinomycetota bacterium]
MDLGARDIHEKQFNDAWRGYNQEEVDDFLDKVAEALDQAHRENAALHDRVRELDQVLSTSRDTEEMLKKTLVTAQQAAEEAIASAKAKAEQLIGEAEAAATRAQQESEERARTIETELRQRQIEAGREQAALKRAVEERVERLRGVESELVQKLRRFLGDQMRALEEMAGGGDSESSPASAGAGPPAGVSPAGSSTGSPTGQPPARLPVPDEGPAAVERGGVVAAAPRREPGPDDTEETPAIERRGVRGLFGRDPVRTERDQA